VRSIWFRAEDMVLVGAEDMVWYGGHERYGRVTGIDDEITKFGRSSNKPTDTSPCF
jgi:hypothetical protein